MFDYQKEIRQAHISKYKLEQINEVTLLMITNDEKGHDLAVTRMSVLLRGIKSNHTSDY